MEVAAAVRRYRGGKKLSAVVASVLILFMLFIYYSSPVNFTEGGSNILDRKTLRNRQKDKINVSPVPDIFNKIRKSQQRHKNYEDADDLQFMKEQAEIQRQRQQTLRNACATIITRSNSEDSIPHPQRFIVDERANLLYCSIAKIASTTWRVVFEQLAGLLEVDNEDESQKTINRALRKELTFMKGLSPRKTFRLLGDSLTFMFARHPFSRILSSYRNKLDPNSTFERAFHWQNQLGQDIINIYRHNKRPPPKRKLKHSKQNKKKKGYDLTFTEFVRFLGDMDNKEDRFFSNVHWCEMNVACSPCNVRYDVIGKLETIEDDAKYILKLAHLDGIVSLPGPDKYSSPTYSFKNNTLEQYLQDVPAEYILKLYERYRLDFEMFGYDLPPIAQKKLGQL